jgi:Nucleotidyl transferase AbiEii toxin, Type IV TA system
VGEPVPRTGSDGLSEAEELQREITRLALRSLEGTSFVLAGSGAIREHGLVDRPTEDVDLFTSDVDLQRFSAAVDAVVIGLSKAGHEVAELRRVDQFARLEVTTADGHKVGIDMGVDWRRAEPSVLAIGPVLSLEDAVGNKLSALYSRAYARDFLDVDSIRASGKFTDAELIRAAIERDPGFEVPMFVTQLELVHRVLPEQVSQYNVDADQLNGIKNRFDVWASILRGDP